MLTIRSVLLAAIIAAAVLAAPTSASAACYSSTPTSNTMSDSAADSEYGISPELTAMRTTLDAACNVSFAYDVIGQSAPISGDFYTWFINTDNNAATGSPLGFTGADYAVALSATGATNLSRWNGSQFASVKAIARAGTFAVATTLDDLFAVSGTPITTAGGAFWSGVYDDYFDWIPEPNGAWLPITPFFAGPPPPPVSTLDTATCVVPGVRGLSLSSAKRKIRNADCSVGSTRKRTSRKYAGRAMGTSPSKGTHLAAGAKVSIYVGKKPHKNRIAATAASSPELAIARINQMNAHAAR
ncbi:MAG: PASTA domain-containing protein [Thermoleophilaceae bacterium]|nr:PASTA domain-containing protein [Thermoleophilaceae bacterium]